MTIDWENAPEGATHWRDSIGAWYKIADDSVFIYGGYDDDWVLSTYEISDINLSQGFIPRPTSTAIPELKKLTQAVFDGLPPEYRWAAVDANARACAYTDDPERDEEIGIFGYFSCADRAGADYVKVGHGYDATDWQDSKIKREESGQTPEAELVALRTQALKMQAEIDALKAQNADLLAALTESLAYVEATLSNHDAGCQRHPSTEHARDCILSDLDQIKTAIAKARGDL